MKKISIHTSDTKNPPKTGINLKTNPFVYITKEEEA